MFEQLENVLGFFRRAELGRQRLGGERRARAARRASTILRRNAITSVAAFLPASTRVGVALMPTSEA